MHILAEKFSRELNVGFWRIFFLEYGTVVKTLEKRSEQILQARTEGAPSYQGIFILHSLESHVPSGLNKISRH